MKAITLFIVSPATIHAACRMNSFQPTLRAKQNTSIFPSLSKSISTSEKKSNNLTEVLKYRGYSIYPLKAEDTVSFRLKTQFFKYRAHARIIALRDECFKVKTFLQGTVLQLRTQTSIPG